MKQDIADLIEDQQPETPETEDPADDLDFEDLEKDEPAEKPEVEEEDKDKEESPEDESEEEELPEDEDLPEEEEEPEKEPAKAPEKKAPEADKAKERELTKNVETVLARLKGDETLKSKGDEFPVKDLTPEEAVGLMRKGYRFYQSMEELADRENKLAEHETAVEQAARQNLDLQQQLVRRLREIAAQTTMPKELEITDDDEADVVHAKKAAQETWKANQEMSAKLAEMESGAAQSASIERDRQVLKEIEALEDDFPLASPEETIAVFSLTSGKVPLRKIMQTGDSARGNAEYVRKIFKHRPEVHKAIANEIVKAYKASLVKATTKRNPVKPGSATAEAPTKKVDHKKITFDTVGSLVRRHEREQGRLARGEEL